MKSLLEIDRDIHERMMKGINDASIKRAVDEEEGADGGITSESPVRRKKESETYWNTRVLFQTIFGFHYKTPQFNLETWCWYLEHFWPGHHIKIYGKNFSAGTEKNLRFFTNDSDFAFNAREALDPDRFLGRFGLKGKVERFWF